ncbi:N-acetyltransferase [Carboxydocella sp. ULO1]|uniref:N-acetyltransferase n=1 Tax=Carboxydocella sp. ULO1 TaxID=1926599 RepID=UPI0009ADE407|nr:N-acetyltransferase [Carboxydocella sp. ULO1]GAW27759.1 acetyltransferase [Carboxydocella sp. ULO1]
MLIRKARMADVESMHQLINECAAQGLMLARSRSMLYETIREFTVIEIEGQVVGTGALHVIWEDLAEIRALALASDWRGKGLGRKLVEALMEEARELGLPRVFALTYQLDFFLACGFREVPMETLPHKVWKECINCPKFPNCDEYAVIIELNEGGR